TLEFTVMARGGMPPGAQPIPNLPGMQGPGGGPQGQNAADFDRAARDLRSKGAQEYNAGRASGGGKFINDAAALEQSLDLWGDDGRQARNRVAGGPREGQGSTDP